MLELRRQRQREMIAVDLELEKSIRQRKRLFVEEIEMKMGQSRRKLQLGNGIRYRKMRDGWRQRRRILVAFKLHMR